jgi:hypothetical protein
MPRHRRVRSTRSAIQRARVRSQPAHRGRLIVSHADVVAGARTWALSTPHRQWTRIITPAAMLTRGVQRSFVLRIARISRKTRGRYRGLQGKCRRRAERRDKVIARRGRTKLHLLAAVARATLRRAEIAQQARRRLRAVNRSAFSTLFRNVRAQQHALFTRRVGPRPVARTLQEIEQHRLRSIAFVGNVEKYRTAVSRCYKLRAYRRAAVVRRAVA